MSKLRFSPAKLFPKRFLKTLAIIGSLGLAFNATAQSPLWNGLVSYWPCDTTVGATTPDVSLGNDLGLINSPAIVAGHNGNCFQFDGTTQLLGLNHTTNPNDTGLPIYSTTGYTVAFWVNAAGTVAANKTIFSEGIAGNTGPLFNIASQGAGKLRLFLRNNANSPLLNNVASVGVVLDGTWHHVAWTDNNGTAKLYFDGVPDTANFNYTAGGGPTLNNTSVGALLRTPPVNFFPGKIDEIAVWRRVLSQSEIQTLITSGIPTPIPVTAPTFTAQPASITNALGDRAVFSVSVYGNRPMTFSWLSNGIPMASATNSTLTLINLSVPGTNFYSLVATNSAGSVTSNPAMLVVLPDAAPNVSAGLVSYWPFDSVTNSPTISTPDLYSQNDMILNFMDTSNLVAGQFGSALAFDGISQYGDAISSTPIYNLSTTYSVAFWVKGAAGQIAKDIFANGNSTNGNYFIIGTDNTGATGKLDVHIQPGTGDILSSGTPLDGAWHHIVWVDQNGTGLLYIDGALDATVFNYSRGTAVMNNTTAGALLANPLRNFFAGALDDVAVWSRRLSYTEIQSIRTNGIPAPISVIKPTITSLTTQPANLTNGVYPKDTVTFTVLASGTQPLAYQWLKNGLEISSALNSSATNNLFTLTDVQTNDSGSYSVVITNAGGAITSSVIQLAVVPYIPVTNGTALQVAFNFAAQPLPQPDFSSMTLNGNPATFNGPKITLSTIGSTGFSDRSRTALANNPPALTQANIYNQFIFSTSSGSGTGIDIRIQRLAPNTIYGLTLWSYDNANRVTEDWMEVASGIPVTIQTGYFFNGPVVPQFDYDYTLGALLTSSANGELEIQGTVETGTSGIFINALRLVANPVIQITDTRLAPDGNLQLTVMTQYPNQLLEFQESSDLSPGSWFPAPDIFSLVTHGPVVTVEFPLSADHLFYRAVSP